MPRTLPSRVVKTIEQLFPTSVKGEGRRHQVSGVAEMTFKFQAVLDLVEQIPSELLTLRDEEYARISASVSALRWSLHNPEVGRYGCESVLGFTI